MDFRGFVESGMATRKPIKRQFEFSGQEIEGYFLDLPALHVRELLRSESDDRDAHFLAAVVSDEAGNPLLTLDQAKSLRPRQMNALIAQALAALGLGEEGRAETKKS